MVAKNDKQESSWIGRDQWNKLWGAKKKVELCRTRTQERGCERLFYRTGVDTWNSGPLYHAIIPRPTTSVWYANLEWVSIELAK